MMNKIFRALQPPILAAFLLLSFASAQAQVRIWVSGTSGASVTDDFNRADGALTTPWVMGPGVAMPLISSFQVVFNGSSSGAYYGGTTFSDNQYASVKYVSGNYVSACVRMSTTTSEKYCATSNGSQNQLYLYDSSDTPTTQIGSTDWSGATSGDVFRLEVSGTSFTVKKNGTSIITGTDSTRSTGAPGLRIGASSALDDFAAGDL